MYLEGIMLSEISQRMTNVAYYHLYVESKNKMNKYQYNKTETDSQCRKQSGGYQWEVGSGVQDRTDD